MNSLVNSFLVPMYKLTPTFGKNHLFIKLKSCLSSGNLPLIKLKILRLTPSMIGATNQGARTDMAKAQAPRNFPQSRKLIGMPVLDYG